MTEREVIINNGGAIKTIYAFELLQEEDPWRVPQGLGNINNNNL